MPQPRAPSPTSTSRRAMPSGVALARISVFLFVAIQLIFEFEFISNFACGKMKKASSETPIGQSIIVVVDDDGQKKNAEIPSALVAVKKPMFTTRPPRLLTLPAADYTDNNGAFFNVSTFHDAFEVFEADLNSARNANKMRMDVDAVHRHAGGHLCYVGSLGTLDELISVVTRLLFMGEQLRRTVVIPPYFTILYDLYLMETTNRNASGMGDVEVTKEQSFCDPRDHQPNMTMQWNDSAPVGESIHKWPEEFAGRNDSIIYIGGMDLAKHTEHGLLTNADQQSAFENLVFSSLFPFKETRIDVHEYITETFGTDSFVAVHLEVTDGALTDPALVQWMLQREAPELVNSPIFLSVSPEFDSQYADIVGLFQDAGAVSFNGTCHRMYEQDMVIREIAAHSAFFYSTQNSSTTKYIDNLRQWRPNLVAYTQYPSLIKSYAVQEAKKASGRMGGSMSPGGRSRGRRRLELNAVHKFNSLVFKTDALDKRNSNPTKPPNMLLATETQTHYQAYLSNMERDRPVVSRESRFPPNGVICQLGTFEQLNNVLIQACALLNLGEKLNRTVVLPPLISQLYDVNFMENLQPFASIELPDGSIYQPLRVSTNESLCDPGYGWKFPKRNQPDLKRLIDNEIGINTSVELLVGETKAPVLVIGAKYAFKFGFENRGLLKHLHAHKHTREIAINFIEENFGNKPFVAVHLRFLDGTCYKVSNGDLACDADPELIKIILRRYSRANIKAPIFVASDHQRPDLELLFAQAGAFFYRGKCHSYDKQCMVVDAEIASRSVYFYGLQSSTAAQNIENMRIGGRVNGTPFTQQTKKAFPFLRRIYKRANWIRHKWTGKSPEKYFASRPKADMDQVALLGGEEDDFTLFPELPEDDTPASEDKSVVTPPLKSAVEIAKNSSIPYTFQIPKIRYYRAIKENRAKLHKTCHQQIRIGKAVLWLIVILFLLFPCLRMCEPVCWQRIVSNYFNGGHTRAFRRVSAGVGSDGGKYRHSTRRITFADLAKGRTAPRVRCQKNED